MCVVLDGCLKRNISVIRCSMGSVYTFTLKKLTFGTLLLWSVVLNFVKILINSDFLALFGPFVLALFEMGAGKG